MSGLNSIFFHRAGATKAGVTFRHFSAPFAYWLEAQRSPRNSAPMNNRMAVLTERHAVGNFIPQLGKVFPFLDMVSVYISNCSAFLAFVPVSLVNILRPLFVSIPTVLFLSRLSGCVCSAFWRAVSFVYVAGFEIFSAPLAGYNSRRVIFEITGVGAKPVILSVILHAATGACFINSMIWHTSIIPRLERMETAFPGIEIERL